MSNLSAQIAQHQNQNIIEQSNAQQTQLQQMPSESKGQQIQQGDQKSNQQQQSWGKEDQQITEEQIANRFKKDESSNQAQDHLKLNQQTESDQVQSQSVVISIDQKKQQQVQQQIQQFQISIEQQMRELQNELFPGLQKVVKVTLFFVSVMVVLQTALMIAAIIARAQGTQCVRWNDGDKEFKDVENKVGVWFIIYIIFSGTNQILFAAVVISKYYQSKMKCNFTNSKKFKKVYKIFTYLTSLFFLAWMVEGSDLRWSHDHFECKEDNVSDTFYGILIIYWASFGLYLIFCFSLFFMAKETFMKIVKLKI